MAIQNKDKKVFDDLDAGKMNRQQLKTYVYGDQDK